MDNLSEILEDKKAADFSREDLEKLANENEIKFSGTTKDATIFKKLVALTEVAVEYVEVKFLLSPTGKYHLAYNVGEIGSLAKPLATELVEDKFAEFVK
jgi:hypothetical protein